MFSIFDVIRGKAPQINIVDVGAMSLGSGRDPYEPLLKEGAVRIVGFEPVQSECDKLNAMHAPHRVYLPYVIGDGSRRTFHECNHAMTSSLYEPNTELLAKFQNLENLTRVTSRTEVDTRRLDDLAEVADTDYLKLDVQGAELDVLKGATNVLKSVVMVHTEVEFIPMYRQQPLFAEVDQVMRQNGFLFHRFAGVMGRTLKPIINGSDVNAAGSQMLSADAVYIRDFMKLEALPAKQLLKLAVLLHVLHQSLDAALMVLRCYQKKTQDKIADRYLRQIVDRLRLGVSED